MTLAVNMNVLLAAIAVYCFQARPIDGVSDGKIRAPQHEITYIQMLTGARDCESALNIDQEYGVSREPMQRVAAPLGVQSGRRFAPLNTISR